MRRNQLRVQNRVRCALTIVLTVINISAPIGNLFIGACWLSMHRISKQSNEKIYVDSMSFNWAARCYLCYRSSGACALRQSRQSKSRRCKRIHLQGTTTNFVPDCIGSCLVVANQFATHCHSRCILFFSARTRISEKEIWKKNCCTIHSQFIWNILHYIDWMIIVVQHHAV